MMPEIRVAWERGDYPPVRWLGHWGPEACFNAGLPAGAQQLWRPLRLLVPSFVKQGCGQDPLQGAQGPLAQYW